MTRHLSAWHFSTSYLTWCFIEPWCQKYFHAGKNSPSSGVSTQRIKIWKSQRLPARKPAIPSSLFNITTSFSLFVFHWYSSFQSTFPHFLNEKWKTMKTWGEKRLKVFIYKWIFHNWAQNFPRWVEYGKKRGYTFQGIFPKMCKTMENDVCGK